MSLRAASVASKMTVSFCLSSSSTHVCRLQEISVNLESEAKIHPVTRVSAKVFRRVEYLLTARGSSRTPDYTLSCLTTSSSVVTKYLLRFKPTVFLQFSKVTMSLLLLRQVGSARRRIGLAVH